MAHSTGSPTEQFPEGRSTPAFSPLYRQIKALILQSLQAGIWKPGELIPSEQELASRFQVSQGTIRKAVDELAAENLLLRRQGKGTFVSTHATQQAQVRFLRLQPDSASDEGPVQRQIVECKRLRATTEIARALVLHPGDAVLHVRRVLSYPTQGHNTPTILEDLWLPGTAFKGLTAERLASYQGPMYALFEAEFGVHMVRATEKIRAVFATAEYGHLLNVNRGTPLLSVERLAFTYNDTPMELRRGWYRTDMHHYRNELS